MKHAEINRELTEKIILYIDQYYHEDISLGLIADHVFFTPQYLGKLFREITGDSFTQYLIRVRMEAAAELLKSTKSSVVKISAKVGYVNVQSFGRVFKEYYKCTPMEYRRRTGIRSLE